MFSLSNIIRVLLLLMTVSVVWHHRLELLDLLATKAAVVKPIVFDNGTVRQFAPASEPQAAISQPTIPHGVMRRCTKGSEVSYSSSACPPGAKEKALSTDRFNVVPGK